MQQKLWGCILLLCALFIVACSADGTKEEKSETNIIPVEVKEAKQGDLIVKRAVYGNTSPAEQTPVMVMEPGEVTDLNIVNGDQVDEDDLLATVKTARGEQHIYAPASGKIAQLTAEEGSMASDEEPMFIIMDTEKLHATFHVTAAMQKLFNTEDEVSLYIEEKEYQGNVLSIDSLPNDTGQYALKVEMENKKDILPGIAAKLEIAETRVKDTLLVPTEAVVTETDDTFVFLADGKKAKKVAVEVTETQSNQTAIKGDLAKGDQVIVKGQFTLSDGATIQIKDGKSE